MEPVKIRNFYSARILEKIKKIKNLISNISYHSPVYGKLNLEEFEMQNAEKQVKIPYIVTIDEGSAEVLSIYRNYKPDDPLHNRIEYFNHIINSNSVVVWSQNYIKKYNKISIT